MLHRMNMDGALPEMCLDTLLWKGAFRKDLTMAKNGHGSHYDQCDFFIVVQQIHKELQLKAFSYEVGHPTQVRSHLQC